MKEELEKLGFKPVGLFDFKLVLRDDIFIEVINRNQVWLNDRYNGDSIFLFEYNHEKLKQLIQILS